MEVDRRRLAFAIVAAAFAALVAMHPHWDPGAGSRSALPVHMDEYVHWGYSQAAQEGRSIVYGNPFSGHGAGHFSARDQLHERGFHAYLAALQALTRIPWESLFAFIPPLVAAVTALAAFVLAERWGAGVEAAWFVAAIPTTLRFLGPGFMVPVMWTLPLILLGLHVATTMPTGRSSVLLLILAAATWPIHVIGGLVLLVLVGVVALVNASERPWRAIALGLAVLLPTLAAAPYYADLGGTIALQGGLPPSTGDLRMFGILPFVLAALGSYALVRSAETKQRAVGVAISLVFVGILLILLLRHTHGIDVFRMYDRGVMICYLLGAILAGTGAREASRALRTWSRVRGRSVGALAAAVVLLLPVAVAASSAQKQIEQPYYVVVSDSAFAQYLTARASLGEPDAVAVVEGIGTLAFTVATGHPTYYVQYPGSGPPPEDQLAFFDGNAADTYFLVSHRITIVVTPRPVNNPDLVQVTQVVYVLREDYARIIAEAP